MASKRPETISLETFLYYKDAVVTPISGLNIPNITIPAHLLATKRSYEAEDNITTNIQMLFNSMSNDNLEVITKKLRLVITQKAQTKEDLEQIAKHFLDAMVLGEQHIKNYMHLLNYVSTACVEEKTGTKIGQHTSLSIGNYFLSKCKNMIYEYISEVKIRSLALLNQDDVDEMDKFTRENDIATNLICIVCLLYEQRNTQIIDTDDLRNKGFLKLSAIPLYQLIRQIMQSYQVCCKKMIELGNPYEDDNCLDEEEYELMDKMARIYASQLFVFMSKEAKNFLLDPTLCKNKDNTETMKILVDEFRNKIVPTFTHSFLKSRCESIQY